MKVSIFIFVFLSTYNCSAQYLEVWKNPDIIWAAEIYAHTEFWVDSTRTRDKNNKAGFGYFELSEWLKSSTGSNNQQEAAAILGHEILASVWSGNWPAFYDRHLTQPMDKTELWKRTHQQDTLTVFDPITEFPKNIKDTTALDGASIVGLQFVQLLYWNEQLNHFDQQTYAIAPIFAWHYWGENLRTIPFWLPAGEWPKRANRMQATSVFRIKTPLTGSVNLDSLSPMKNYRPFVMDHILNAADNDSRHIHISDNEGKEIPISHVKQIISWRDTVTTYDPETYEDATFVVENRLDSECCTNLIIEEDWYWDPRKKRLFARLNRIAPVCKHHEMEEPVFWLRFTPSP